MLCCRGPPTPPGVVSAFAYDVACVRTVSRAEDQRGLIMQTFWKMSLAVALVCALVPMEGTAQPIQDQQAWSTRVHGGVLTAYYKGLRGQFGIAVNCSGSQVVVVFQFPRPPLSWRSTKIRYTVGDGTGARSVTGRAPDPLNPQLVAVSTSHSSHLLRKIKSGEELLFVTEDTAGEEMTGVLSLRGSSKALSRLSCVP